MPAIVEVIYCPERSGLTFRLCHDTARQNIRVSWNAEAIPKVIFGGARTTLHLDGISVYDISQLLGMITRHRIQRLVLDDTPVSPKQGIFAWLSSERDESIPVFSQSSSENPEHLAVEFRQHQHSNFLDEKERASSTTLSESAFSAGDNRDGSSESPTSQENNYPGLDWEAVD